MNVKWVKRFNNPMTMNKYLNGLENKIQASTMSEPPSFSVNNRNYFIIASIADIAPCRKPLAVSFLQREGFTAIKNLEFGMGT